MKWSSLICVGLLALCASSSLVAFSLRGPSPTWQTPRIGYAPNVDGVVNLNEEYRWNVPTIVYAYGQEFLRYFGPTGRDELEEMMDMFNNLGSMTEIDPNDFPLRSMRVNYRAQALGLHDLKTAGMSMLMQSLGMSSPDQDVFRIRGRLDDQGISFMRVIKRNFDPITWDFTSFINGRLWTYSWIVVTPQSTTIINSPVDPLDQLGFVHAPVASGGASIAGGYWTRLTRDDIGGLKYIYRKNNINVEVPPDGAIGSGINFFNSPFVPPLSNSVAATFTSFPDSPWNVAAGTNQVNTNAVGGAVGNVGGVGGAVAGTNANLVVTTALRTGLDRIHFQRADFDSLIGGFFVPMTNQYQETIITNSQSFKQQITYTLTTPNIVWNAGDLLGGDTAELDIPAPDPTRSEPINLSTIFTNLATLNNDASHNAGNSDLAGPGVIGVTAGSQFVFTFNTVGPGFYNFTPGNLNEFTAFPRFRWGSFDGSTNEPYLYPNQSDLLDIEREILGR